MRDVRVASAALCASLLLACSSDAVSKPHVAAAPDAASGDAPDAEAGEPTARPEFCARPGADPVRTAFCADERPILRSLEDVMTLVDANVATTAEDMDAGKGPATPLGTIRYVALLGHSTALSGHQVSPINPRAIVLGKRTLLAYQRGTQQVELASYTQDGTGLHFYLVRFEQACNARPHGCSPGDLYTPRIERDWTRYTITDEEALKNTPLDCRQCHQRGLERGTLLMRELESPWTHFFFPPYTHVTLPGVNGTELTRDYLDAKGDEPYGGFAVEKVSLVAAAVLQTMVGPTQPLLFNAPQILAERYPNGAVDAPQPSPTWEHAYEAFKRGEQLALPYLETRATDPEKQRRLTQAYQRYRSGEIRADELPDLADIFPDDPELRARIGLQTEPDATPVETLIQGCGSCHNDVLDQTVSRARFNVDLSRLDRAEIEAALDRLERPRGAPGAMPPPEARQLDPGARDRLIEFLRSDPSAREPNAQLSRAASLGMKGGAGMGRYQ
jgi:mono/diheme cytochrome c family protein